MSVVSSFEVLAQRLIPPGLMTPPGADLNAVPFVLQAYFIQVSLPAGIMVDAVSFDLNFEETTKFQQGSDAASLLAQVVDETGNLNTYSDFLKPPSGQRIGFNSQAISPGQTKIYSVTALPVAPSAITEAGMPQTGIGWRGLVSLDANPAKMLIAMPTQRQISFTSADLKSVTDSVAYPVATATGSLIF